MPFAETRSGQVIESLHGGAAGIDGVLAELELEGDLDEAGEEDDPEADESGFSPEESSGNELPRTDNGSGKDESGP